METTVLRTIGPTSVWRIVERWWHSSALWIPAFMVAGAVALPIVYLIVRTLDAGSEFWEALLRLRTLQVLGRSLLLVVVVTVASVATALPLAWLTVRTDLRLRRLWAVLIALPLVIPSYVGGFLVIVFLGPRGMVQRFLEGHFGVERLPEVYGFPGAAFTLTILSYPYVLLSLRAALERLDPSLEENASSLGYSRWVTFWRVTFPQLRPGIATGALLVALYTLSDFGAVSLLRYETFTWAIYVQYETAFDRTAAANFSLILVVVAMALILLESKTRGRWRYHRSGMGTVRPPVPVRLGRWSWPAIVFCSIVVGLALVLPVGVLGYWLVRGMVAGEPLRPLWGATLNSAYISILACFVVTLAAVPVAWLSVRRPCWASVLIERVSYSGFALPGIVIALSLVFFGARYAGPLYQNITLLIFAYIVLFLPVAVGATRTSLLQINPNLEDAARGLGRRPWATFATVTLPLARPGVMAGTALAFLLIMKELPATLLLAPIGYTTLATWIWSAAESALFAQAALATLILVAVSLVPMAFLILRGQRRML